MRIAPVVVSGALVALASPSADAGRCAETPLSTVVLSPKDVVIDDDGGVVVGEVVGDRSELGEPRPSKWSFSDGRTTYPAKLRPIAPGLVSLLPSPLPAELSIELTKPLHISDVSKKIVGSPRYDFVVYDESPVATPTTPRAAKYSETRGRRSWSREVTITLAAAPPAGVIAIVALDAKGQALSWAPVSTDSRQVAIWATRSCVETPRGYGSMSRGDKISVAWVDTAGHVSPRSKELVIR